MEDEKGNLLVFEKLLSPAFSDHKQSVSDEVERRLQVIVVFTSADATIAALKRAGSITSCLTTFITLVVPQVVPYPLPLKSPPVLLEFNERRFRIIAEATPAETTVRLYLCRDRWKTLKAVLKPNSLIVVGGRRRWWATEEKRLVRKLRRAGHDVILTETN
ncbi:MAG TPA: hypothetical protein VLR94_09745 [Acidobacteriota bacterium]|nr:hypothetical protein [Acidobacteriota bacterium]